MAAQSTQTQAERFQPIAERAKEAMGVLAWLLKSANQAELRGAKPIVFDFYLAAWHFDPNARGYVAPGDRTDAALRVSCSPETLIRLLREPGVKLEPGKLLLRGDVGAMRPLIDSLKKKTNLVALRASNTKGALS